MKTKKITLNLLSNYGACIEGIEWFKSHPIENPIKLLNYSINNRFRLDWANWLIVKLMNKKQRVQYAVFAAKLVLPIYQKKYPDDDRPEKAIEAAERYLNRQSTKNKNAAAAYAAAAYAADAAAAYAAYAAYAADAAYAYAAAYAAAAYAAAAYAADADKEKIQIKILKYGLTLLK